MAQVIPTTRAFTSLVLATLLNQWTIIAAPANAKAPVAFGYSLAESLLSRPMVIPMLCHRMTSSSRTCDDHRIV